MKDVLQVGVIGCGEIAQIAHIPYLMESPLFAVSAICDISRVVVDAVGDRFGIQARFLDYREMIQTARLDAVLVCCHDHSAPVIAALDAGKHVIVEKPLAFNLDQADRMIAASARASAKLMVGYMKCYDPALEWALPRFRRINDLHLIRVHDFAGDYRINEQIYDLIRPVDVPRDRLESMQGAIRDAEMAAIGVQNADLLEAYDMLLYLCSHDARLLHQVYGAPQHISYSEAVQRQFVFSILEYPQGVRCVWETGLSIGNIDWDEQFAAYGESERIELRFPFPYLRNAASSVWVNTMEDGVHSERRVIAGYDEAFRREWRHFYDCVTEDKTPLTNGEAGRMDLELLINMIKAIRGSRG